MNLRNIQALIFILKDHIETRIKYFDHIYMKVIKKSPANITLGLIQRLVQRLFFRNQEQLCYLLYVVLYLLKRKYI